MGNLRNYKSIFRKMMLGIGLALLIFSPGVRCAGKTPPPYQAPKIKTKIEFTCSANGNYNQRQAHLRIFELKSIQCLQALSAKSFYDEIPPDKVNPDFQKVFGECGLIKQLTLDPDITNPDIQNRLLENQTKTLLYTLDTETQYMLILAYFHKDDPEEWKVVIPRSEFEYKFFKVEVLEKRIQWRKVGDIDRPPLLPPKGGCASAR